MDKKKLTTIVAVVLAIMFIICTVGSVCSIYLAFRRSDTGVSVARADTINADLYSIDNVEFSPLFLLSNNLTPVYDGRFMVFNNTYWQPSLSLPVTVFLKRVRNRRYQLFINEDPFTSDNVNSYPVAVSNGEVYSYPIYNALDYDTGDIDFVDGLFGLGSYLPQRINSYNNGRSIVYGSTTTQPSIVGGVVQFSQKVFCLPIYTDLDSSFDFDRLAYLRVFTSDNLYFVNDYFGESISLNDSFTDPYGDDLRGAFALPSTMPLRQYCMEFCSVVNGSSVFARFYFPSSAGVSVDSRYIFDQTLTDQVISYNNGYNAGYTAGQTAGSGIAQTERQHIFDAGVNYGRENATVNYSFMGLLSSVVNAPITALVGKYVPSTYVGGTQIPAHREGGLINLYLPLSENEGIDLTGLFGAVVGVVVIVTLVRFVLARKE